MSEPRTTGVRAVGVWLAGCTVAAGVIAGCGSSAGGGQAVTASSPASAAVGIPSSSGSSDSGRSGTPAAVTTIRIGGFAYETPPTVGRGSTVQVMNMDQEAHTVTADAGKAFDVTSPPGRTVTFTAPSTPGTYAFHCTYHGTMHGVLVVT